MTSCGGQGTLFAVSGCLVVTLVLYLAIHGKLSNVKLIGTPLLDKLKCLYPHRHILWRYLSMVWPLSKLSPQTLR